MTIGRGLKEATTPESEGVEVGWDSPSDRLFKALRWAGWALIAAQFVGFVLWSSYLTSRASFGHDTAIYFQSWDLIAHGHFLPKNTIQGGYLFWKNDGEFILYLLAPLYWLFPNHLLGLLWLQDLALSGTIAVCYKLVTDRWLRAANSGERTNAVLAGLVAWAIILVLFLLDPWIYWVPSFDIHMETFGVFFLACAFVAFRKGQRRGYLYALLTALCGTASVVYVVSLGVLLAVRPVIRSRREREPTGRPVGGSGRAAIAIRNALIPGLALAAGAVVWLYALSALHATQGSPTGGFVYLLGAKGATPVHITFGKVLRGLVSHPGLALRTIFLSHSWNLWANTSPAGLFGLLTPVGFLLAVPTLLLDNLLKGQQSSYPTFQNLPEFIFIAVGTAGLLAWLIQRRKGLLFGVALAVLVIGSEIGWFAVWFPKTRVQWIKTSAQAASVIWRAERMIPPNSEVVMTNGTAGPFGGHADLFEFYGPAPIPIQDRVVWFVLSPAQGIEVVPTEVMERAMGQVAELPGSKMVIAAQGIYVFRWNVPSGYHSISLGAGDQLAAWTTPGIAATADLYAPRTNRYLASSARRGYVLDGDYWREFKGSYTASVRMTTTGTVNVEVWDDTTNQLLARTRTDSMKQATNVLVPFRIKRVVPGFVYQGAALFRDLPIPQIPGEEIEVRVWSNGTPKVNISSIAITRDRP